MSRKWSLICVVGMVVGGCSGASSAPVPGSPLDSPPPAHLLQEIRSTLEAAYHNPGELSEPRWNRFWQNVEAGFGTAESHEDLRLAFRAAVRELGISHLSLQRSAPSPDPGTGLEPVRLSFPEEGVALLEVDFFSLEASAELLTDALSRVVRQEVPTLMVDLRENPGGDVSSMLLAGHLITEPAPVGIFLSRKWWEDHDAPPSPDTWSSLPVLAEMSLAPFYEALTEVGALLGVIPPMTPTYRGQVYLLTSPRTRSAAEPLVHFMKEGGLATVVGERTGGAMLSSETFLLSDGWHLVVPVADFIAADGVRLEGRGVEPDVAVPAGDALRKALELSRGG